MNRLESLRRLIADLVHEAGVDEIHEVDDAAWGFGFQDESVVVGEWADEPPRLLLTCYLGTPPEWMRLHACELLLALNRCAMGTDGVRGAMGERGSLCLAYELPVSHLNASQLAETLQNLAGLGTRWRQAIGIDEAGGDQPDSASGITTR